MKNKDINLINVKHDLEEAIELIEVSRKLFQEKLTALKEEIKKTKDLKIKEKLEMQATALYEDYKKSLAELEKFINETTRSINN